ncbi:SpoVR family protein [Klebsiella pneumoniae subsp. pneumoniae]|nr:SpoVR family protein [Klebsiella pneumoniae subsp. pneumoniae]
MNYGVDRYKRPQKSLQEEKAQQKSRKSICKAVICCAWHPARKARREKAIESARRYPSEPQENLLYFMEKNAPLLEPWRREILHASCVKSVSNFCPQKQTQVMMNEGGPPSGTTPSSTISALKRREVTERFMLEFSPQPYQRGVPAAVQQSVVQRD